MNWSLIGLGLIVVAWIIQAYFIWKKNNKVNKTFVALYAVGVLVLTIDGFKSGLKDLATMNLLSLIIALVVLVLLMRKK